MMAGTAKTAVHSTGWQAMTPHSQCPRLATAELHHFLAANAPLAASEASLHTTIQPYITAAANSRAQSSDSPPIADSLAILANLCTYLI